MMRTCLLAAAALVLAVRAANTTAPVASAAPQLVTRCVSSRTAPLYTHASAHAAAPPPCTQRNARP